MKADGAVGTCMKAEISRDGKTIVVTISIAVKKRDVRKLIIAQPGMSIILCLL